MDLRVEIAGEVLVLMPERVAAWPGRATLLVADAHFGKAASFRAAGIPVPRGTTGDDLASLDTALARAEVRRVVFDHHASIVEGSIGALQRRLMVLNEDWSAAKRVLDDAGEEFDRDREL